MRGRSPFQVLCVAVLLAMAAAPAAADFASYQVAASADDTVAYSTGENYYSINELYSPYSNNTRLSFVRWAVDIPAGATIQSAVVKLCSTGEKAGADPSTVRLTLLDYDSTPAFTSSPFSWSLTAYYADWEVPGSWTQGQWYTSGDVSAVVQAFVNRPGYSTGNYLGLRLSQAAGAFKRAYQYDYSGHTSGPVLEVTYTTGGNQPPVANAGSDQTVTDTDDNDYETVMLDGSGSSDSDGTIVSYIWTEGVTQIAAGQTASVTLAVGTHTITLTVTDDDSATDDDTVVITVNELAGETTVEYQVAASEDDTYATSSYNYHAYTTLIWPYTSDAWRSFMRWQLDIPAGTTILSAHIELCSNTTTTNASTVQMQLLDYDSCPALNSANPFDWSVAGSPVNWLLSSWTAGEWYESSDVTAIVQGFVDRAGYAPGNYLGLRGVSVPTSSSRWARQYSYSGNIYGPKLVVTYAGSAVNVPPVADAGSNQTVTDTGDDGYETVTLDGTDSSDSDGTIVSYIWYEGVTQIATGATANVTLAVGTHTVTLVVTDDDSDTDEDDVTVTINSPAAGSTYYVDQSHPSANNSNPGTESLPWLTIGKAATTLEAGDTAIVKEGVYRESVSVAHSGTSVAPITFQANVGDRVVISGADLLTGWTQLPQAMAEGNPNYANIYYKEVNWKPPFLYEDEAECRMSREPDYGWWFVGSGSDTTHIVDTVHLTQGDSSFWVGATMYFMNYSPMDADEATVTAYNPATHTVTVSPEVATEYGNTGPEASEDYYYMFNKVTLIDQPGEWCWKDLGGGQYRLYVWPFDSGSASSHTYEASKIVTPLFGWAGRSNIILDGFEVRHGNGEVAVGTNSVSSPSTDITIQNCTIHHNKHYGIWLTHLTGGIVRNSVSNCNGYGICVSHTCEDIAIYENEIGMNWEQDALSISSTTNLYIERNYIHHHSLWGHPDNLQIFGYCSNVEINDNVLLQGGQACMLQNIDGITYSNNMLVGSDNSLCLFGDGVDDSVTDHNVFGFSSLSPLSLVSTNMGADWKNNIYYDGNGGPLYSANSSQGYESDYNVWCHASGLPPEKVIIWNGLNSMFADYVTASGQDTHSYYADPLFVNAPVYLDSMSPTAVPMYTPSRVYLGNNPGRYLVGDHIEISFDGIMRTITAKGTDSYGTYIDFTPAMADALSRFGNLANWKTKTDCQLDLRVQAASPAKGNGEGASDIGSDICIEDYQNGDFDGDSVRDVPPWPPED